MPSGDPLANIGLSQRRAEVVRAALVARGVDAAMLRATGYGAVQPIVPKMRPRQAGPKTGVHDRDLVGMSLGTGA